MNMDVPRSPESQDGQESLTIAILVLPLEVILIFYSVRFVSEGLRKSGHRSTYTTAVRSTIVVGSRECNNHVTVFIGVATVSQSDFKPSSLQNCQSYSQILAVNRNKITWTYLTRMPALLSIVLRSYGRGHRAEKTSEECNKVKLN